MSNKSDQSPKRDEQPKAPQPQTAEPDLPEDDRERQADHGGEGEMARRNQSLKDTSLGAPVTGMPGTPKPARRG